MPSIQEVSKHDNKKDCWVIIHGKAYDVTEFLPSHPGGQKIILRYAGKDCTKKFDPVHPPDTLEKYLSKDKHLGDVTGLDNNKQEEKQLVTDPVELKRLELVARKPPLHQIYNLMDFEYVARNTMEKNAWAYYSSGCDDEITLRENHYAYQRIFFIPRILVNVTNVDFSRTMLGAKSQVPFYVTATALGKLGHPDGEKVLTRACHAHGVVQMIPTLASCSFDEIVDAAVPDEQTQWFQLYVNSNRQITEKLVRHAETRGAKGLFITVDAPQLGRREKDMRTKYEAEAAEVQGDLGAGEDEEIDRSQGAARAISSFIDTGLSWDDLAWFKSITKMPIVLKGVLSVEDALKAAEYGVQGIVLSNHGGRQLEFSRSGIEILAELMPILRERGLADKFEVFVDGGVRRATDILKAIALGAKGVGIGRPFLYAMSTYGDDGVKKAFQILKDEFLMNMRLLGITSLDQLNESYVDTRGLLHRFSAGDALFNKVYEPLVTPQFKPKFQTKL